MSPTRLTHANLRPSPPHVRKVTAKAPRSALVTRTTSSSKLTLRGATTSKSKVEKERTKPHDGDEEEVISADEDEMGTSFLQFCAMCEKQIAVPNNSILYCSEDCRRRDASHTPASFSHLSLCSLSLPSLSTGNDLEGFFGIKDGIAHDGRESMAPALTARIPPMAHDGKSDLDPTEWKPNLPRSSSEAMQYLGRFHRSSTTLASTRPPPLRTRNTSVAFPMPSLSHTPTTSTSPDESWAGTPYEINTRPLLPRLDPKSSISSGIKSVDLVTPYIPSAASAPTRAVGPATTPMTADMINVSFEKKWIVANPGIAAGSLRKLLEVRELGHVPTAAYNA